MVARDMAGWDFLPLCPPEPRWVRCRGAGEAAYGQGSTEMVTKERSMPSGCEQRSQLPCNGAIAMGVGVTQTLNG